MSVKQSPEDSSTPPDGESTSPPSDVDIELEVGETVEIILDGDRIDAFLSDNVMVFDPASIHSRLAARTYAYSIWADGDEESAKLIFKKVGREG